MNYTETYRKIYSSIKTETMPHEIAHNAALRIADAIGHIYQTSQVYKEETLDIIKDVIAEFKIGGYDLDDRGQPTNFGTSATGLNNNK
jgi:hypothetical protein